MLFYLKEDVPSPDKIAAQCLEMFRNFHARLMVIERDTVCQCGACQTASNLTLKFIAHFGEIKEIRVAQFVKATGIDMIVAHRLLKNSIGSNEYILITQRCLADNASPLSVDGMGHMRIMPQLVTLHFIIPHSLISKQRFPGLRSLRNMSLSREMITSSSRSIIHY